AFLSLQPGIRFAAARERQMLHGIECELDGQEDEARGVQRLERPQREAVDAQAVLEQRNRARRLVRGAGGEETEYDGRQYVGEGIEQVPRARRQPIAADRDIDMAAFEGDERDAEID